MSEQLTQREINWIEGWIDALDADTYAAEILRKMVAALQSAPPASEPQDANEAAFADLAASGGLAETMETAPADRPEPSEALPDCMMPDGAEPCEGYRLLQSELEATRLARDELERLYAKNLENAAYWREKAERWYGKAVELAGRAQPAPSVPEHWSHKHPGLADQYRAEALACRRALGFSEASENVSPSDITQALAAQPSESPAVPDRLLHARLPVSVGIPPGGTINAGCKVRTLLLALVRRGMEEWRGGSRGINPTRERRSAHADRRWRQ